MDRRPVDRLALVAGLVFIIVGFVFLLERLGIVDVSPSFVVPVLLVALGIGLLIGRGREVRPEPVIPTDMAPTDAPPAAVVDETLPQPTMPVTEDKPPATPVSDDA